VERPGDDAQNGKQEHVPRSGNEDGLALAPAIGLPLSSRPVVH
jgi:hypothetical protein